jgi:DNA-binding Lrp family transcriptional regulator
MIILVFSHKAEPGEEILKNTELRLVSELMKNSRRSDRELSRVLGISQPTVSRLIKKLEKEGVIREYTMIPDFAKLGYELMVITLGGYRQSVKPGEMLEAQNVARREAEDPSLALLMLERGLGPSSDAAAIVLYRSYSEYDQVMQSAQRHSFLDTEHPQSFLINLKSEAHYLSLTFSALAGHLLNAKEDLVTRPS